LKLQSGGHGEVVSQADKKVFKTGIPQLPTGQNEPYVSIQCKDRSFVDEHPWQPHAGSAQNGMESCRPPYTASPSFLGHLGQGNLELADLWSRKFVSLPCTRVSCRSHLWLKTLLLPFSSFLVLYCGFSRVIKCFLRPVLECAGNSS
jgi:hypothetical protein